MAFSVGVFAFIKVWFVLSPVIGASLVQLFFLNEAVHATKLALGWVSATRLPLGATNTSLLGLVCLGLTDFGNVGIQST